MPNRNALGVTALAVAAVFACCGCTSKNFAQDRPVSTPQAGAPAPAAAPAIASRKAGDPLAPVLTLTPAGYTYTPQKSEAVSGIVRRFWSQTSYMTRAELESAIREQNKLGKAVFLKSGQTVVVPGVEPQPVVEKAIVVPPDFEVRAIYLTGAMAASDRGIALVRRWRAMGGNAVVFDIKDSDGIVNVPFEHPLALRHNPAIPNLPKYVRFLHANGMHAIARIALFRDEHIAQRHSELAVRSRRTGEPWLENGKLVWTDPSNPQVQDYDLALARAVAAAGADEIQFDYVRFPAEGDQKDAQFAFQSLPPCKPATSAGAQPSPPVDSKPCGPATRAEVIAGFLERAYEQLHPQGTLLSVDVFGVMAWQRSVDLSHTGQDIPQMARYCDVLSPMIYPSHFFNMDGYAKPGDAPEHFISESMQRFRKITADTNVVLRPWLQAFAWRTKTYSAEYVRTQVLASRQNGGDGFLFWNARNDYAKPIEAMPQMKLEAAKYLRGDELADAPRLLAEREKQSTARPAGDHPPESARSVEAPQPIARHSYGSSAQGPLPQK